MLDESDIRLLIEKVQKPLGIDDFTLESMCTILFGHGYVRALEAPVNHLIFHSKRESRSLPEIIWQIKGYTDFLKVGLLIPERRALRFRPHTRKVLSFYHAVMPYHSSGYASRTHALAKAAREHGQWTYQHHSRIGYPWDVRGKHKLPTDRKTWHDGIAYIHDRGHATARGDLRKYIGLASASIRRAIYLERPSVVHAASAYVNALPALLAARSMGVPFVYEVRGLWELTAAMGRENWEESDRFKIEKQIETMLVREADGIIAITDGVRRELIERGADPAKIVLSPNATAPDALDNLPVDTGLQKTLGLDPTCPTIGYIGSFVQYEGLELLLEAVVRLKAEGLRFNVLLVGDGPSYASFRQTVADMQLEDTIILPGRVTHDKVAQYYSVIDITIFPRLPYKVCELVSPLKPLEALLLGKLVIGSSVSGIREIVIHGENGLIHEAGNLDALVDTLRAPLVDLGAFSELREKGRAWVLANRRWQDNITAAEGLLDRISPSARLLDGPMSVIPGTSISVQGEVSDIREKITLTYNSIKNGMITQNVPVAGHQNETQIFADVIVPHQANILDSASALRAFQPAINTDFVENFYHFGKIESYIWQQDIAVSAQRLECGLVDVVPGQKYSLKVDILTASKSHADALLGIYLKGAKSLNSEEVGLRILKNSPNQVYTYLTQKSGVQHITFTVPKGIHQIRVFLKQWSASTAAPMRISSALRLTAKEPGALPVTLRVSPASQAQSREAFTDIIPIGNAPALVTIPVQSSSMYDLTFNIVSLQTSAPDPSRAGVITYKFTNSVTGESINAPKMRYSKGLALHFTYFNNAQKLIERIVIPKGADRFEIGVRSWNAEPGQYALSGNLIAEKRSQKSYMLDWNGDPRSNNILLFADVNVNIIDGSSVWLISMAKALARTPGSTVHLVLRYPIADSPFANELNEIPNCRIIDPLSHFDNKSSFTSAEMPDVIRTLDAQFGGFDSLVVRGFNVNYALCADGRLEGRLCPYLTDIPQRDEDLTDELRARVELIFRRARAIFLQSSWLISFVRDRWTGHETKFVQLPPMLPDVIEIPTARAGGMFLEAGLNDGIKSKATRIVYAGKMAPEWGILELFDAFDTLRAEIPDIELHILGSKIHDPKDAPEFFGKVHARLLAGDGLSWFRDLDRQSVLRRLPTYSVGWSWRDPDFENSNLELSTKLLEYGKSGLPVILTQTERYRSLLTTDYPFLASSGEEATQALRHALTDKKACDIAIARLQDVIAPSAIETVTKTALTPTLVKNNTRNCTVLIAGHDLKFSGDLQSGLIKYGYNVLLDKWQNHNAHDVMISRHLLKKADKIICEWAMGNLVWYARNKLPHQKLVARLHAQELFTDYPEQVDWEAVDAVAFVSEQYRQIGIEKFSIPVEKCVVIPNTVNTNWYRPLRGRKPGKRIGMMGIVPWLKRPDLALDIVEAVLEKDPEFTFSIKGKMPSDYSWMKDRPEENNSYMELMHRIVHSPSLNAAVTFDGFGHDVPIWAQDLDFILSTSDRESFHLSVAECAATGAHPVVLPWAGASALYPEDWVVADVDRAAKRILTISRKSQKAQYEVLQNNIKAIKDRYEAGRIVQMIENLLNA